MVDLRRNKLKERRKRKKGRASKRERRGKAEDGESEREKGCVWHFRGHVMINAPVPQTRMLLV